VPDADPIFLPARAEHILLFGARLGLAAILGAILGIDREKVHSAAGLRTHILVCLGAAVMVLAGHAAGFGHDASSRVMQGIIAGIGFLGAGTILKVSEKVEVHGLTTAASIWVTAAVGISAGLGHLWLSAVATLVGWLVLGPLRRLEKPTPSVGQPKR
jgi:putative Mg2+ transporter-C (MgtC) family protein